MLVPADETKQRCLFKAHYINCILEELGFNFASGNPIYTHSSLSKGGGSSKYMSVMNIFNFPNFQN